MLVFDCGYTLVGPWFTLKYNAYNEAMELRVHGGPAVYIKGSKNIAEEEGRRILNKTKNALLTIGNLGRPQVIEIKKIIEEVVG